MPQWPPAPIRFPGTTSRPCDTARAGRTVSPSPAAVVKIRRKGDGNGTIHSRDPDEK